MENGIHVELPILIVARFLWVSCQLDQLARLHTTTDIHAAFNSLPRGLYRTYHRILENIPPEYEIYASRALRWVAYAAAPIRLDELIEAIAVNEGSSKSLEDLRKLMIPQDIIQICGSLLRYSDFTETMSLVHTSVFEFLIGPESQSQSLGQFRMVPTESTVLVAKTCLTYLSFQDFRLKATDATTSSNFSEAWALHLSLQSSSIERPFLDYALRYWWKHLTTSGDKIDELLPYIIQFFDPQTGNFRTMVMLLNSLEGSYKYPLSMRPIHFCATNGISRLIPRLFDNSLADVDDKLGDGRTALHLAVENGHICVVQELLDQGATW